MRDRFIHNLVSSCGSHNAAFCSSLQYFSPATAAHFLPEIGFSGVVGDTPLSPSHAGDKGDSSFGQRPVDMVCVTAALCTIPPCGMCNRHLPICKEEGKAAVSVPSKQNTNTTAPAAVLSATPAIANTNSTTVSSVQIANAYIEGDAA